MNVSTEREILFSIRQRPHFLTLEGVSESLFTSDRRKKIFRADSDIYEEAQPETIDDGLLSVRSGLSLAQIGEEEGGCYALKEPAFLLKIAQLKIAKSLDELFPLLDKEKQVFVKTGTWGNGNLARVRDLWNEIEALEKFGKVALAPILRRLSEIEVKPVSWLFSNYIPLSALSGLTANPGVGKTFFALFMAACVTTGHPWPDGSKNDIQGNVLYLSGEDSPADTLHPRIRSLGGDPGKIFVLDRDGLDLSTEEGISALEREIDRIGDVRLLVLDPALDFSGQTNSNAAEQTRGMFLSPLRSLAEKASLAWISTDNYSPKSGGV